MKEYIIGTTIVLRGEFSATPDSGTVSCKVYKDGTLKHTAPSGEIVDDGSNKFHYNWDTDEALAKGIYTYVWSAKYQTKDILDDGTLKLRTKVGD